jgi:hypothetical protein
MKKVKEFVKEHKTEILVGVLTSAVSSYIWLKKGYRVKANRYLSVDFGLDSTLPKHFGHGYLQLSKECKYTMKDLGKLGKDIMERSSNCIKEDQIISTIGVNYDF